MENEENGNEVKYNNLAGVETYWYKNIVLTIDEVGDKKYKTKPHAKITSVPTSEQRKWFKFLSENDRVEFKTVEEFMCKYTKAIKIIEEGF